MDYTLECTSLHDCTIPRYSRSALVYNVNLVSSENLTAAHQS